MIDTFNKIQGHLTVECIDKAGNVVDRFENHNLVMDTARQTMSQIIAGLSTSSIIDKFVLGTKGHVDNNYLLPKTSNEGFVSSRTELFSEELGEYTYPIEFTVPGTSSGACVISNEGNGSEVAESTIDILHENTTIQYTIVIPAENANGSTGTVVFTEAALYAGNSIFSMKCFNGKIKDETVSIKIIWKILF